MSYINAAIHFILANKGLSIAIAYVLMNVIVALTPKRFQEKPIFGIVLLIFHKLSVLAHSDQNGTLQIPLIAKEIVLFADEAVASVKTQAAPPPPLPVAPESPKQSNPEPPKAA